MTEQAVIGSVVIAGVGAWLVKRVLSAPDKAKADIDEIRADLATVEGKIAVLEQQVSGPGFGLTTVVGRLADAVEKLDTVVTRIDARMERMT